MNLLSKNAKLRSYFLGLLALCFSTISCRPIGSTDESLELSLIKTVIEKESSAFNQRDFALWASCYKQDEQTFWVHIEKAQLLEARGWTALSALAKSHMEKNPTKRALQIARDNYHARIVDGIAWVTFDELQIEGVKTRRLRGVRILEKEERQWKISYVNSYEAPMQ